LGDGKESGVTEAKVEG